MGSCSPVATAEMKEKSTVKGLQFLSGRMRQRVDFDEGFGIYCVVGTKFKAKICVERKFKGICAGFKGNESDECLSSRHLLWVLFY